MDGIAQNLFPSAYIQNHINWCWATAAKIVGFHYLLSTGASFDAGTSCGTPRLDSNGLRMGYIGQKDGVPTVDIWQARIVAAARDKTVNPDGNAPEGDEGKARAIKYVISGDPNGAVPSVSTLGDYRTHGLWHDRKPQLDTILTSPFCMIGNYQRITGDFHSLVLKSEEGKVVIYDPWDGSTGRFTVGQAFGTGFLLNTGPGVIKWIQYIQ